MGGIPFSQSLRAAFIISISIDSGVNPGGAVIIVPGEKTIALGRINPGARRAFVDRAPVGTLAGNIFIQITQLGPEPVDAGVGEKILPPGRGEPAVIIAGITETSDSQLPEVVAARYLRAFLADMVQGRH